jgi:hypothetical protein
VPPLSITMHGWSSNFSVLRWITYVNKLDYESDV